MPIYDYICSSCDKTFERTLSIADKDLPANDPCPNCGAENTIQSYLGNSRHSVQVPPARDKRAAFNKTLKRIKKFHKGSTIDA